MNTIDIKALEAKYGKRNLHSLTVKTDEGETFDYILCKPTRSVIKAINSAKGDPEKSEKVMVTNGVVAGDMAALEYGDVYLEVLENVSKLFKKASGTLKKI